MSQKNAKSHMKIGGGRRAGEKACILRLIIDTGLVAGGRDRWGERHPLGAT
jgi:hypothetical protein